jgi:hypothetical protein
VSNRAHRRPHADAEPPAKRPGLLARLFGAGREQESGGPVPVGFANSRVEAELMAGYLRDHGIRAAVLADDEGGLAPMLQMQRHRVRVLVPHAQHSQAKKLLDEKG